MISSEIFRTSRHASGHPLAIPRVALTMDLCRALGWLDDAPYIEAQPASVAALLRFHTAEYVAAVQRAEATQDAGPEVRSRFNLGINGNPVYGEVFRRPATACGASLQAARHLLRCGGLVYSPAGGTHHGQPGRASGYCIFNDPVLAILELLDQGLDRVAYVDWDAHFGDGVQQAFHHEARVRTISIHEAGRWPMARGGDAAGFGGLDDRGGGFARNLPVPAGLNDDEFAWLIGEAVAPLLQRFAPQAIVVQSGCDALADDPMTRLSLSNRALWRALADDHAPGAAAAGAGRWRLQSLGRRPVLGRHLGDDEQLCHPRAAPRDGGGGAAEGALESPPRPPAGAAMDGDAGRSAAVGAGTPGNSHHQRTGPGVSTAPARLAAPSRASSDWAGAGSLLPVAAVPGAAIVNAVTRTIVALRLSSQTRHRCTRALPARLLNDSTAVMNYAPPNFHLVSAIP